MSLTSPLVELARSSLVEEASISTDSSQKLFSEKQIEEAMKVMNLLIYEQIDQTKARFIISTILKTNTVHAVDKIIQILNIPSKPIQNNKREPLKSHGRQVARSWRKYEDQRLLAAVHRYGTDDWNKICKFVGSNRSSFQCSQRWFRVINPAISHSAWTTEEEKMLVDLIEVNGIKSWKLIAEKMKTRSDVQCRYHFKYLEKKKESENSITIGEANKESPQDIKVKEVEDSPKEIKIYSPKHIGNSHSVSSSMSEQFIPKQTHSSTSTPSTPLPLLDPIYLARPHSPSLSFSTETSLSNNMFTDNEDKFRDEEMFRNDLLFSHKNIGGPKKKPIEHNKRHLQDEFLKFETDNTSLFPFAEEKQLDIDKFFSEDFNYLSFDW